MASPSHAVPPKGPRALIARVLGAVFSRVTKAADPAAGHAYVTSLIRTGAPLIAGWLLGHLPFVTGYVTSAQAQAGVSFGLAFGYYALVRLLETRWPALGRLLGKPVAPTYAGPVPPILAAVTPLAAPAP